MVRARFMCRNVALVALMFTPLAACVSFEPLGGDDPSASASPGGGVAILGEAGVDAGAGRAIQSTPSPPTSGDDGTGDEGPAPKANDASSPTPVGTPPPSDAGAVDACDDTGAPLTFGAPTTMGPALGGDSGVAFREDCPAGSALVGFDLVAEPNSPDALVAIQSLCSAITVSKCTGALTFASPTPLANEGSDAGTPSALLCPKGDVLTSVSVTAGKYVHSVSIACSPLIATASSSGIAIALGAPVTLGPAGGSGTFPLLSYACPAGSVGDALAGSAGGNGNVDSIALVCATPSAP